MKLNSESVVALQHIKELTANKKVVFVSGNFNIIHPGHLRLLRFAKECGDFLVVGVNDSKFGDAIIMEEHRLESIKAISWVDYSFVLHDFPSSFIKELKPACVIKGKEFEERYNEEAEVVKEYGGKLIFGSGDVTFSSIDLIRKEWRELNLSTIKKPADYPQRHGFTCNDLIQTIERMSQLNVCIIGDTIIDEYITCDTVGMSQEDPTIVVSPVVYEKYLGGAGIVAAHIRNLAAKVHFFSVTGNDDAGKFSEEMTKKYGIKSHLYIDESRPTTLKQRFRASEKTLLRVSHLRQHSINKDMQNMIVNDVCSQLDEIDLLVFSDFNYGCLPQHLVDRLIDECVKRNIMMVADSQSSSQVGDVSRFKHQTLLTPTEREGRLALHDYESGLIVLADGLRKKAFAKNIIFTLGSEGLLIYAETNQKDQWHTDRLPAMNNSPKDVAGAGDSLLATTSMAMALGCPIWQAAYIGSLAAACQVGRIGNIPVNPKELLTEIKN